MTAATLSPMCTGWPARANNAHMGSIGFSYQHASHELLPTAPNKRLADAAALPCGPTPNKRQRLGGTECNVGGTASYMRSAGSKRAHAEDFAVSEPHKRSRELGRKRRVPGIEQEPEVELQQIEPVSRPNPKRIRAVVRPRAGEQQVFSLDLTQLMDRSREASMQTMLLDKSQLAVQRPTPLEICVRMARACFDSQGTAFVVSPSGTILKVCLNQISSKSPEILIEELEGECEPSTQIKQLPILAAPNSIQLVPQDHESMDMDMDM